MERRLAAIFAADVVGYSRLIRADEDGTLAAFRALRADLIDPIFAAHKGRIVKTMGDGLLVEFASVVGAVRGAAEIQQAMAERNTGVPEDKRIVFRIGVNLGDVVIEGDDIHGDGVNVAARLEGLAEPGGICVSGAVHDQVRDRLEIAFEDMGDQEVKNIDRPVRAWRWLAQAPVGQGRAAPDRVAQAPTLAVPEPPPLPDKPSIAVLPFDNMSGDPEQGYFADGITEDIITDLSKVSGLFVIARNSSFVYKGKSVDLREVCRELGVRYALEGSVRKAGNRVRINAQMIDGSTGGHLWAERYDRDVEDIFAVQDEVTREIVGALEVELTSGERTRRETRSKVDPEAYDCYVRARHCIYQFTPELMVEGKAMLERTMALDPEFAPAYAYFGIVLCTEYVNGWNAAGPDYLTRALQLADKACELDRNEPIAYHALTLANMWLRNMEEAERAAARTLKLDPNYAEGYATLGSLRDFAGRHESAIEQFEQSLRLDPKFHVALQFLGRAQFGLERYAEAEASFNRRLIRHPRSDMTRVFLASIYGHTGRHEEARRVWDEMLEINPDFSIDHLEQVLPFQDPAWFERLAGGLRKAGLPD